MSSDRTSQYCRSPLTPSSIEDLVGEFSPGDTDTAIARVENGVKPLQECHAADEVHAGELVSNVLYGQVNGLSVALYGGVQRAGPDLSVRDQLECLVVDDKVERLEALVLVFSNAEEMSITVQNPASGIDVFIICV